MPDLLRPQDVQEQYNLSRSTLLRYEAEGKLKTHRTPGGQRRYDRADLDAMISGGGGDGGAVTNLPYREFGVTGVGRWQTSISEEPLRELKGKSGKKLLHEMRINDSVIWAIFLAIENSMKKASWRVQPASEEDADKEAAEFIDSCLHDMSFSWSDTLSFILVMLEQGFSVLELVYKKRLGENPPMYIINPAQSKHDDGRIGWRKWSPRPAESLVENDEWVYDANGGVIGINQQIPGVGRRFIPIEKLLLFRTTVAPVNSPEGMPIHRGLYRAWWFSQNIEEIEGIGLERDLTGIPVIYLGDDATMKGTNSDFTLAQELVRNLRVDEQAGIVIPKKKLGTSNDGNGILLELLSTTGRRSYNTTEILERYDKRKALSVLAQFIMLGMDKVGSFALSKNQNDLFVIAVTAWLQSIADTINMYAIPRLMAYNSFTGLSGYPKLVPGTVGVPDLQGLGLYINQLVAQEVITPDPELERHLRQIAGLPEYKPPEPVLDENGNPVPIARQGVSVEKAALLLRRVGLALRSMTDLGAMTTEQAAMMLYPLMSELRQGIKNELGEEVPEIVPTFADPEATNQPIDSDDEDMEGDDEDIALEEDEEEEE